MSSIDLISDHSKENLLEVPKAIVEKTGLKMLFLEGNMIYQLPEDFFQCLPKLVWLDLRNNKLRAIPDSIAHHKCLENLLLSNNELERLPNALGTVRNLRALQVTNNPLLYPPREILVKGVNHIKDFLKSNFNQTEVNKEEEEEIVLNVIGRESESSTNLLKKLKSSKTSNINVKSEPSIQEEVERTKLEAREKAEGLVQKAIERYRDPRDLKSTISVKSFSKKLKPEDKSQAIVHKISRTNSKVSLRSYFDGKVSVRNKLDMSEGLKDNWLDRLKVLLQEQERILQQERNLRTLSGWRVEKKKAEQHKKVAPKFNPPYGTYEGYNRILSREDLNRSLNELIKERTGGQNQVPQSLVVDKLIEDLMKEMKELEENHELNLTPRSEMERSGRQIRTIMEIHRKLLKLKEANDVSV